jgi:hypothetical protein
MCIQLIRKSPGPYFNFIFSRSIKKQSLYNKLIFLEYLHVPEIKKTREKLKELFSCWLNIQEVRGAYLFIINLITYMNYFKKAFFIPFNSDNNLSSLLTFI